MARPSPYSPEQKEMIAAAVKTARKDGTWPDALKAAKEVGYKGGLQYLMKFVGGGRKAGGKQRRGGPAGKRGHPAKAAVTKGSGLNDIDRIVEQMVNAKLAVALNRAIVTIEGAAKELRAI